MLRRVGFTVREAENGQEAVGAFRSWAPHAILMDLIMPVMDGVEATRRIMQECPCPIVVGSRGIPVLCRTHCLRTRDTEPGSRFRHLAAPVSRRIAHHAGRSDRIEPGSRWGCGRTKACT